MHRTGSVPPAQPRRETAPGVILHGIALAVACVVSYEAITVLLDHVALASAEDDALGGMWAVVATVFVYRRTFASSMAEALSRMSATLVSFVLCLAYLVVLPFSVWGLAALIGIGSIAVSLAGRPEDTVTTGITTAVVMVVAGTGPAAGAWQQPVLRLVDTAAGVAVGIGFAQVVRLVRTRFPQPDQVGSGA